MSGNSDDSLIDHVLAVFTLGSCVYVWWLLENFDLNAPIDPERVPVGIVLLGTASVIAAIVFWVRMYRDFFRERPAKHAALWGVALLVGAHLTALVYFVVIWRPRQRRG